MVDCEKACTATGQGLWVKMADFRSVAAVSEAVVELLQARYQAAPQYFNTPIEFKIYMAKDFVQPTMAAGVSLFLYRIFPNGALRSLRGRPGPDGQQYRNQLPLDLHFILTAWAQDPSLQHLIAGWMMRMIEDAPILPPGLLNQNYPNLFSADEGVAITAADLSTEELLRMWEVMVENSYQISVPYVARFVKIDSDLPVETGRPVQERTFDSSVAGRAF